MIKYFRRIFSPTKKHVILEFTDNGLVINHKGVKKEELQSAAVTFFQHSFSLK